MPLLHCNSCYHEWEGRDYSLCDWCGSGGYILEEKTSFEKMMKDLPNLVEEMAAGIKLKRIDKARGSYLTILGEYLTFYRKWYEKIPWLGDYWFRKRIQGAMKCQQK